LGVARACTLGSTYYNVARFLQYVLCSPAVFSRNPGVGQTFRIADYSHLIAL
jgi:hypothetical protein